MAYLYTVQRKKEGTGKYVRAEWETVEHVHGTRHQARLAISNYKRNHGGTYRIKEPWTYTKQTEGISKFNIPNREIFK